MNNEIAVGFDHNQEYSKLKCQCFLTLALTYKGVLQGSETQG